MAKKKKGEKKTNSTSWDSFAGITKLDFVIGLLLGMATLLVFSGGANHESRQSSFIKKLLFEPCSGVSAFG